MDLYLVFLLLCSFLFAFLVQQAAKMRGRSQPFWFCMGLLFGIFALIALYMLPQKENALTKEPVLETGQNKLAQSVNNEGSLFSDAAHHETSYWYFINKEKEAIGPMSFEHLCQDYLKGKFNEKSYVWADHMTEWASLESLPSVKEEIQNYKEEPIKELPPTNDFGTEQG